MKTYKPIEIQQMSSKEINREYTRLRAIANKRIERLNAQNINYSERPKFATIKQINESSKWDVASQLAEVSRWVKDSKTTVTGAKQSLDAFSARITELGYGNLLDGTYQKTIELLHFLEDINQDVSLNMYDSGDTLDTLEQAQRLNIPLDKLREHFDLFASHLDELEKIEPTKGGARFSTRRINALINKWSPKEN